MGELAIIAALLIAGVYFTKASAAKNLKFFISSVSAEMQGATPVIVLQVMIQNPTNEAYQINALVGNLSTNSGYLIGNVSGFQPVPVAAQSQQLYNVNVRVNLIGTALDIFNLVSNGQGLTQIVRFDGAINVSGVVVPVELDYKIL